MDNLTEEEKKHLIVALLLIIIAMQLNILQQQRNDDDRYGFTFHVSLKCHLMYFFLGAGTDTGWTDT